MRPATLSAFISATKSGCLEWGAETSTGRGATGVDKSPRLTSSYPAFGHCFGGSDLQYRELLVSYCACFGGTCELLRLLSATASPHPTCTSSQVPHHTSPCVTLLRRIPPPYVTSSSPHVSIR